VKKWLKTALIVVGGLVLVLFIGLAWYTRGEAHKMVIHPMETREMPGETPADYGLPFEEVAVTTADGLQLVGWYIAGENGAAVIAQHGYKGTRANLLYTAQVLHEHGYGVLLSTFRTHDASEGERITLGKEEMQDFDAWYQFLLEREDVDPARIAIFGESYGGTLATKYATQNPEIRALILHSALATFTDSVDKVVYHYTGLPPFPFSPMMMFWAGQEIDLDVSTVDATVWIRDVHCPVFVLQGGQDDHISIDSGQKLYDAANEPKEYWFEPGAAHHGLDENPYKEEFEERVIAFYDQHLLAE